MQKSRLELVSVISLLLPIAVIAACAGFFWGTRYHSPDSAVSREPGSLSGGARYDDHASQAADIDVTGSEIVEVTDDEVTEGPAAQVRYRLRPVKGMRARDFSAVVQDCRLTPALFGARSLYAIQVDTSGKPAVIESIERTRRAVPAELWQCRFKAFPRAYVTMLDSGTHAAAMQD